VVLKWFYDPPLQRRVVYWFYNGFNHRGSKPSKHLCRRYMRSTEYPSSSKLLSFDEEKPFLCTHFADTDN